MAHHFCIILILRLSFLLEVKDFCTHLETLSRLQRKFLELLNLYMSATYQVVNPKRHTMMIYLMIKWGNIMIQNMWYMSRIYLVGLLEMRLYLILQNMERPMRRVGASSGRARVCYVKKSRWVSQATAVEVASFRAKVYCLHIRSWILQMTRALRTY